MITSEQLQQVQDTITHLQNTVSDQNRLIQEMRLTINNLTELVETQDTKLQEMVDDFGDQCFMKMKPQVELLINQRTERKITDHVQSEHQKG